MQRRKNNREVAYHRVASNSILNFFPLSCSTMYYIQQIFLTICKSHKIPFAMCGRSKKIVADIISLLDHTYICRDLLLFSCKSTLHKVCCEKKSHSHFETGLSPKVFCKLFLSLNFEPMGQHSKTQKEQARPFKKDGQIFSHKTFI